MVCSSGVGFDPALEDQTLHFELSGLYNAVMVMSDDKTDTVWSHLTGEGLDGKYKGKSLPMLPTYNVTWGEWRERHPDTTLVAPDPRYAKGYAPSDLGRKGLGQGKSFDGSHLNPFFKKSLAKPVDARLPGNALVLGVTAGEASRAYPLDAIHGKVLLDELGGMPLAILVGGGGAMAFDRRLDRKTLTLAAKDGKIQDGETGSTWDPEGRAVDGPLKGKALAPVFALVTEWYGWAGFRAETGIYGAKP